MITISVLICTKNRNIFLHGCLSSLLKQRYKPYEVIIVDNGSNDDTKETCMAFSKTLPIQYHLEKRVGIPYGRNLGIRRASGDICTFIDDDCLADHNWLSNIAKHFSSYRTSVGVVGYSHNLTPNNIPSEIEQLYYERWFSENIPDPKRASLVLSGRVIDFKNCALRTAFIKKNVFSIKIPFGDVGDEDIEIGNRLYRKNTNIYFDPAIIVFHQNSPSVSRLLYRNFWEGFANRLLLQNGLNVRIIPLRSNRIIWFFRTLQQTKRYRPPFNKILFVILLMIYPVVSNAGRLYASTVLLLSIPNRIPVRK